MPAVNEKIRAQLQEIYGFDFLRAMQRTIERSCELEGQVQDLRDELCRTKEKLAAVTGPHSARAAAIDTESGD